MYNSKFHELFLGKDEMEKLRVISFEKINHLGSLVTQLEPQFIKSYISCIQKISQNINYPLHKASLLFNLLIFQTETWESNELMDLEELKKIQAIYNLSKEILHFGCDQVEEISCLRNLKQVILSLTIMKRISRTSHVMMNLESSSLLEMPCLIEEGVWIKQLDDMCLDIYAKNSPDDEFINDSIAIRLGKRKKPINQKIFGLWSERFHSSSSWNFLAASISKNSSFSIQLSTSHFNEACLA